MVPTDFEAALIVDELSRSEICARVARDYAFGFDPVHVIVTREDSERAEAILKARQPNSEGPQCPASMPDRLEL